MAIYLIAITIFSIQCFVMIFLYFDKQKDYQDSIKRASKKTSSIDDFFYFILIPCLNEGKVIQNTLEHVLELDGHKQIIVIDDDSDDDTVTLAKNLSGPISIIQRKLPNARVGKGDSLNSAMPLIKKMMSQKNIDPDKCIIGVLDADGVFSKNTFYRLSEAFSNPKTDAAQMRVKMKTPKKLLQTFQDIEFFVVNNLIEETRTYLGAVAFCGNGQFFRYSTITKKINDHPWGNALLEDFELSLRLQLHGLTIDYLQDAYVDQEALVSLKRLINQRARWAQGGLECWKYASRIIKSKQMSFGQKFDAYFFLCYPFVNFAADISIIYMTVNFFIQHINDPEFIVISVIILATFGLFFGILFTAVYLKELHLFNDAGLVINRSDMLNENISMRKLFLAIGLMSYVYVILFFSLTLSLKHEIFGQNTWNKTKRI